MTIGVISCVKTKLDKPAKAKDIYISPLFKKSLAYSQKHFDKTIILSAKYGLLNLETVIEPYEMTLKNMSKLQTKQWAYMVIKRLNPEDTLFFLCGSAYYKPLLPYLKNKYTILFKGLSFGKRLRAL